MVKIINPEEIKQKVSESEIQTAFEKDLTALEEGLVFVEREFERGSGRIDTLAVDEYGTPVFIEYKREGEFDEAALIQILDYVGWFLKDESRVQNLVSHIREKMPGSKVSDQNEIRLLLVVSKIGERVRNACYAVRNPIKVYTYNLIKLDNDKDVSLFTKLELDNGNIESGLRQREGPSESDILEKHSNLTDIYNKLKDFINTFDGVTSHTTGSGDVAFKIKKNFLYATFQKKQLRLAIKVGPDFVKAAVDSGKIEGPFSGEPFFVEWLDPSDAIEDELKHEIEIAIGKAK